MCFNIAWMQKIGTLALCLIGREQRHQHPMSPTKTYLTMLAGLALVIGAPACADERPAGTQTGFAGVTAHFAGSSDDRDRDGDHNDDDTPYLAYGQTPRPATAHRLVALVREYFKAAAAADGARACALLAPLRVETVVEENGDASALSGRTCGAVMSNLFAQHRAELAVKLATLRIPDVRVQGNKALAILEFPTLAEVRQIGERRTAGHWRMFDLLDRFVE